MPISKFKIFAVTKVHSEEYQLKVFIENFSVFLVPYVTRYIYYRQFVKWQAERLIFIKSLSHTYTSYWMMKLSKNMFPLKSNKIK